MKYYSVNIYSQLLSKVHLQSNHYLQETRQNVETNKYAVKIYKRQKYHCEKSHCETSQVRQNYVSVK